MLSVLSFFAKKILTEDFDSLYAEKKLSEVCSYMLLSNCLLNFFPNSRANCLKASTTLSVSGPSSSKEQLRNEKARILLPYNKFASTFEVLPVSWQLPSLFQGSVAIQKMFLTLNALQSRHNVKSLFESSGKAAGPYLSFLKHEATRDISSSPRMGC